LKALTCIAGRDLLYRYCADRNIEHRRCGKFIVASDAAQIGDLEKIAANARACGVDDLAWLDGAQARRAEPALECVAALWSPSTGIVDSHAFMLSLVADVQAHGAAVVYDTRVAAIRPTATGIELGIEPDADAVIRCRTLINAAGLDAVKIARVTAGLPESSVPVLHYAKGTYFSLSGRAPFHRLVYPVPDQAGLGIHMTLDLSGGARFGPDVEWVGGIDYGIDEGRAAQFCEAIRRYWPALDRGRLQPAYAGVRPKLSRPGQPAADFLISGPDDHGIAGIVNLFGIESPGLTASLALAERTAALAGGFL